jgi:hypothetical protein
MGSNPIIGTCEKAFHEGKATNTARLADSAHSRVYREERNGNEEMKEME